MRTTIWWLPTVLAVAFALMGERVASAEPVAIPQALGPTGGDVKSVAVNGTTAFLGGSFRGFGPKIGGFAVTDPTTGDADLSWPRSPSNLGHFEPDGAGGVYAAGQLTVGGVNRTGVFHVRGDGTADPSFVPTVNGEVRALKYAFGVLYIGGLFTQVNGNGAYKNLAAVSATSGALVTAFRPDPDGAVNALGFANIPPPGSGTRVYAAGAFTKLNGGQNTRRYFAGLYPANGIVDGAEPTLSGVVTAMDVGSTPQDTVAIRVVGDITSIGNPAQSRSGAAAFDDNGAPLSWAPQLLNVGGEVRTLAVDGNRAYITSQGPQAGSNNPGIYAFDLANGALDANFKPLIFGPVTSMAFSGSTMYVGGQFNAVNEDLGTRAERTGFAAIDKATGVVKAWDPVVSNEAPTGHVDPNFPKFVGVSGSKVFIGGSFSSVATVRRGHLAALDLATGAFTAWAPTTDAPVNSIALDGARLYLGGAFTKVAGVDRSLAAAVTTATGAVELWNPRVQGGEVTNLHVTDNAVFIAGKFSAVNYFTPSDSLQRAGAAGIDKASGLARRFSTLSNYNLKTDILVRGDRVWATEGADAPFLIDRQDTDFEQAGAETPFAAAPDQVVRALAADETRLYAAGAFLNISGAGAPAQPRRGLAALDLTTGAVRPLNAALNGDALDVEVVGPRLFTGGLFTTAAGGAPHRGIVAIDRATDAVQPWNPGLDGSVTNIGGSAGAGLFVAGTFTAVGGQSSWRFARFALEPLAPGAPSATAGEASASVAFTAPANGGSPITGYTVTASPGGKTASGAGSPLTVTGLDPGTTYSFKVTATNAAGTGPASAETSAAIPLAVTNPGTPQDSLGTNPGGQTGGQTPPGGGQTPPGGGQSDLVKPVITATKLTNKRFALASGKTAVLASAKPAAKKKKGTAFTFTLSENAATTFTITRRLAGRLSGKKCVAPRKGLTKRCTRSVPVVTLKRAGSLQGANTVAFTGRYEKKKLSPGSYAVEIVATDAAGNTSAPVTLPFTVVR